MEVIPGILAKTPEQLYADLRRLEKHTSRVHIDVIDGLFAPNATVGGYEELLAFSTQLKFDVHMMVNDPVGVFERWRGVKNADRFLVHVEATGSDAFAALSHARVDGRSAWAALDPGTGLNIAERFIAGANGVLILGVHPGFSGQKMLTGTAEKVALLHERHPHIAIGVDGGINPETAPQIVAAGATMLVATSFVLNSPDISRAIKKIQGASL